MNVFSENLIQTRSRVAYTIYALLNPIPYGFFVAVFIFDVIYCNHGNILFVKASAWLITFGLLFAILPRLINLFFVWFSRNRASFFEKTDFWLNLMAIFLMLVNAFVHSRDAFGAMPDGLMLSAVAVILMSLGLILVALQSSAAKGSARE